MNQDIQEILDQTRSEYDLAKASVGRKQSFTSWLQSKLEQVYRKGIKTGASEMYDQLAADTEWLEHRLDNKKRIIELIETFQQSTTEREK